MWIIATIRQGVQGRRRARLACGWERQLRDWQLQAEGYRFALAAGALPSRRVLRAGGREWRAGAVQAAAEMAGAAA
jgi:hypothetical protein